MDNDEAEQNAKDNKEFMDFVTKNDLLTLNESIYVLQQMQKVYFLLKGQRK